MLVSRFQIPILHIWGPHIHFPIYFICVPRLSTHHINSYAYNKMAQLVHPSKQSYLSKSLLTPHFYRQMLALRGHFERVAPQAARMENSWHKKATSWAFP